MKQKILLNRSVLVVFIIILSFVFSSRKLLGQDQYKTHKNLMNIIPPSPDASSLGKYGEIGVSKYTGIPQISIPIYTVNNRGLQVPIALNYHSGGVRVEEHAPWVGLGWSLTAGGLVTRTVVGLADDLEGAGYLGNPIDINNFNLLNETQQQEILQDANNGNIDLEPDTYSFNVLNISGKFFINKANRQCVLQTQSNIKIQIIGQTRILGWKITDEGGNIYFFEERETTRTRSFGATNRTDFSSQTMTSTWHLSRIIQPNGDTISFIYQDYKNEYFTRQGASKYIFLGGGTETNTCDGVNPTYDTYSSMDITGKRIAEIRFNDGKILFKKSTTLRQDMPNDYYLAGMEVYNNNNDLISSHVLNYGYFESNLNCSPSGLLFNDDFKHRLKLLSVTQVPTKGETPLVHSFDYHEGDLPSVFSNSQDHWGFYNGKNNCSLIPLDNSVGTGSNCNNGIGVDRSVDFNFAKVGTLKKITYPTGGYTLFEYESNDATITEKIYYSHFYPYGPTSQNFLQPYGITVTTPSNRVDTIYVEETTSKINEFANFSYTVNLDPSITCNGSDRDCIGNLQITLTCIDCEVADGGTSKNTFYALMSGSINNGLIEGNIWLIPGKKYRLNIQNLGTFNYVSASIYGKKEVLPQSDDLVTIQVGGLRIKELTNYSDQQVIAKKTKYQYLRNINQISTSTSSTSSGVMVTYPLYSSLKLFIQKKVSESTPGVEIVACYFRLIAANSTIPLGGYGGSSVGYANVQTLEEFDNQKLKTETAFYSSLDYADYVSYTFPTAIVFSRDVYRGEMKKETIYKFENNQFYPQTITDNLYSITEITNYAGVKNGIVISQPPTLGQNYILSKLYYHSVYKKQLTSTIKKQFESSISNPMESITNYFYDNALNANPVRVETKDSKGKIMKSITNTPFEKYNIISNNSLNPEQIASIDEMINRNIVNKPIEKRVYKDEKLIERILFHYTQNGFNHINNTSIRTATANNPLDTKLLFGPYDAYGNLLEQQKANDVRQAYIYDYQLAYPIAEIINAGYNEVAYTSFEADGKGNFNFTGNAIASTNAPTGNKVYQLSSGAINYQGNSSQPFILSFWANNNAFILTVNGTTYQANNAIAGITHGGFTYYQWLINGNNQISIQTSNTDTYIDELRLYPQKAMIKTFTYKPLIGISSQTDTNGKTIYYEYDGFNRLKLSRDHNGQILKLYDYRYQANTND